MREDRHSLCIAAKAQNTAPVFIDTRQGHHVIGDTLEILDRLHEVLDKAWLAVASTLQAAVKSGDVEICVNGCRL